MTERIAGVLTAGPGEVAVRRVKNEISGRGGGCRLIGRETQNRGILRRHQRQDGVAVTVNRMKKRITCSNFHALLLGEGGSHQLQTLM